MEFDGFGKKMMRLSAKRVLVIILAVFIVTPLIFPIGIRVANDFPFISSDFLKSGLSFPSSWNYQGAEGLGEYGVPTLWSWPFRLIMGALAHLGFGYSTVLYITLVLPIFVLGIYSIDTFLKHFGVKKAGRIIGGLLYFANTYFLLLVDGGQISIALEYALFPLVFVLLVKSLRGSFRNKLVVALVVVGIGILEPRAFFLLGLLTFLYILWELAIGRVKEKKALVLGSLATLLVALIVFVGLNFYWILPGVMSGQSVVPPGYVVATSSVVTWKDAITLHQPQWYKNIYGITSKPSFAFYIIPMFAFLSLLFSRKNRKVFFWIFIAVLSVFMAKGVSPPFGDFYNWLFTNVPGFFVFRDATKFFFLVALSYSLLFGFTIDQLAKRSGWISVGRYKIPILLTLVAGFLLFLVRPAYLGRMTGIFSVQRDEKSFLALQEIFKNDNTFGRVLWLPSLGPLSYSSNLHPSLEGLRILRERPIELGVVGTYELFNFLREAPFMGQIMNVAGVKYLGYLPPDPRREIKQEDLDYYNNFATQLTQLPWIAKKIADTPFKLFETRRSQDRFFVADNTYYIVGSDSIYSELQKIPKFDLANNALVFAESSPDVLKTMPSFAKIILFGKQDVDIASALLPKENFIFPAYDLPASPAAAGWWKRDTSDFLWLRDFLQQKYNLDMTDLDYGGGYAVSEGNNKLTIQDSRIKNGDKLLVRLMTSSRGGRVEFWQGDKKIGEVDTKSGNTEKSEVKLTGFGNIPDQLYEYDKVGLTWFEIGKLVAGGDVTIKTSGDINVLNTFSSVSDNDWAGILNRVQDLKESGRVVNWNDLTSEEKDMMFLENSSSVINYEQIIPSHYKVTIENLNTPSTLVFSESYNSDWTSNKQKGYKVYSLLNGFPINGSGEYDIYFEPQRYVVPGLWVSAASLAVIALYFLYNFLGARKN